MGFQVYPSSRRWCAWRLGESKYTLVEDRGGDVEERGGGGEEPWRLVATPLLHMEEVGGGGEYSRRWVEERCGGGEDSGPLVQHRCFPSHQLGDQGLVQPLWTRDQPEDQPGWTTIEEAVVEAMVAIMGEALVEAMVATLG